MVCGGVLHSLLIALAVLLAILPQASYAEVLTGRVVGIADGDTLTVAVRCQVREPSVAVVLEWGFSCPGAALLDD